MKKAFHKVWHDIRKFIKSFNRVPKKFKKIVILNSQSSFSVNINAGVLQDSILGPLFFLIHVFL